MLEERRTDKAQNHHFKGFTTWRTGFGARGGAEWEECVYGSITNENRPATRHSYKRALLAQNNKHPSSGPKIVARVHENLAKALANRPPGAVVRVC